MFARLACTSAVLLCFVVPCRSGNLAAAFAEDSLHDTIDRLIEARAGGPLAGPASDEEFVRRVYLDLAGRIPSTAEVRAFLDETTADKRTQLIDRLLGSADYPRRMRDLFHVLLMERQGDNPEWTKFLETAFASNTPWDKLTQAILCPNADDEQTRGAAFFITRRLDKIGQNVTDYPGLTRDVGRLFLGVDLQCAQCHDHLFVNDYKQLDYHGLFAFLGQTFIRRDVKFPAVGESLVTKKSEFMSVFVQEKKETGPRVPFGEEIAIPQFEKGDEYLAKPDRAKQFDGTPKFSPLKELSTRLPTKDNRMFARNIANRLWLVMMGRGLVHPPDLIHGDNPASHPELLDALEADIVARQFDVKSFLRELMLTKTYQRSGLQPDGAEPLKAESYRVALEKPLSAEQLLWSALQATGNGSSPADSQYKPAVKLEDLKKRFVTAFANPPKEPEIEFAPSVKSALFIMNDSNVLTLLTPAADNLVDRLTKLPDADGVAKELYLCTMSRLPTDEERADVTELLGAGSDRATALRQMAWALLASTEFCLNH